jgi:hypothetical protein
VSAQDPETGEFLTSAPWSSAPPGRGATEEESRRNFSDVYQVTLIESEDERDIAAAFMEAKGYLPVHRLQ